VKARADLAKVLSPEIPQTVPIADGLTSRVDSEYINLNTGKVREQAVFLGLCQKAIQGNSVGTFEIDRGGLIPHVREDNEYMASLGCLFE